MIRQLILTDFLAHRYTVLDLGPGLTVLTGPNNSGKSAIVEALRCLATNPTPKHVIRHGAKECSVEAVLDDGVKIVWKRKPRYAMYEIHRPDAKPEVYAKMGRSSVPEPVAELLRLAPVELEAANTDVDVHIGNQREPIFLLDKPGSVLASFFASSTEASHLVAMQQALKNRVALAVREDKELKARLVNIADSLDALQTLPDVRLLADEAALISGDIVRLDRLIPRVEALLAEFVARRTQSVVQKHRLDRLEQIQNPPVLQEIRTLLQFMRQWSETERSRHGTSAKFRILQPLAPCPQLQAVRELGKLCVNIGEHALRITANVSRGTVLSKLRVFPVLQSVQELGRLIRTLEENLTQQRSHRERKVQLDRLGPLPVLAAVVPLKEMSAHLRIQLGQYHQLKTRLSLIHTAVTAPALAPTTDLAGMITQLRAQRKAIKIAHTAVAGCQKDLDAARVRIRSILEKAGHCPTCGGALTLETFLGEEHRHA